MKIHRLDLFSHLSHELGLADLELIESLDGVRTLLRRTFESPGDRSAKRELKIQKENFWAALEIREATALDLARVTQARG